MPQKKVESKNIVDSYNDDSKAVVDKIFSRLMKTRHGFGLLSTREQNKIILDSIRSYILKVKKSDCPSDSKIKKIAIVERAKEWLERGGRSPVGKESNYRHSLKDELKQLNEKDIMERSVEENKRIMELRKEVNKLELEGTQDVRREKIFNAGYGQMRPVVSKGESQQRSIDNKPAVESKLSFWDKARSKVVSWFGKK